MKADEQYLYRFLSGTDLNFIIPIYQRNYDWKLDQCKQLFDDIENLIAKNLNSHFFGSIVCKPETMNEIIIIDGQQRITTISLLLLAMYNYIHNSNIEVIASLDERILTEFLVNKYSPDEKKIKLKPIKKDQEAFERLFENNSNEFIQESHLTQNYLYLYERVEQSKCSVNQLYDAITKLMVVVIQLHPEDNPQLIFESMNSTGLDLSEADKIRNYVLMDKPYNLQKEYYEKYWNRIEENVGYNTTDFIKDYLTMKMSKIPTFSKIYKIFKDEYIIGRNLDISEVLKDMYDYSDCYKKVVNGCVGIEKIDVYLRDIAYLKYTLLYPFITRVIYRYENNEISEDVVYMTLKSLMSYIVRRIVTGKPTNALPKFFCTMDREIESIIKKDDISFELYDDVFSYILRNRKGYVEFPTDEEFKEQFVKFRLYKMQTPIKNYILRELENYNNKERITIKSIDDKEITIEHIMPQTLTPAWKNYLGEDYNGIYEKYIDTIGNLTLTAYNSELQNKPYKEKKEMQGGYLSSKLFLSSTLEKYDEWNESNIIDRADLLSDIAIKIWEEPNTEYIEKEDESLIYNLSDTEISYINTKIKAFKMFDKEYEVLSWRDFAIKVISFLYELDKIPLLHLVKEYSADTEYGTKRFSMNESELRSPVKIDDNLYVEMHYNSDSIVDLVRLVLEKYELELNEVDIKLKENNASKKGVYDIETLSRVSKAKIKSYYEELDKMILSLDENIEKAITKHYVAYRYKQNFLELHLHADWLTLYMFPNVKYEDPENRVEYLEKRTWVLTARVFVKENDDINYIFNLIKASYEVMKE